jgi:hypothetical protein
MRNLVANVACLVGFVSLFVVLLDSPSFADSANAGSGGPSWMCGGTCYSTAPTACGSGTCTPWLGWCSPAGSYHCVPWPLFAHTECVCYL